MVELKKQYPALLQSATIKYLQLVGSNPVYVAATVIFYTEP